MSKDTVITVELVLTLRPEDDLNKVLAGLLDNDKIRQVRYKGEYTTYTYLKTLDGTPVVQVPVSDIRIL